MISIYILYIFTVVSLEFAFKTINYPTLSILLDVRYKASN